MKKKSLLLIWEQSVSVAFLFTLLVACQKTDRVTLDNNSVAEAKNWFSTNVLAGESRMLAKPFSELPETSPLRLLARMNKLSKKLDWSKAITGSADKLEYVLVPLQKDDLPLKNSYFMKRAFVFYKYNSAPMQMQVVELLTKNQPAANPVQLAATLFERKVAAKKLPAGIQNVQAFFYDKEYTTLDAIVVSDGRWQALWGSLLNKPAEQAATKTEGQNCEVWGVFRVTYDENGNIIESELLYTYLVCRSSGDDLPEEQPGEGGGGGEENGYEAFRTLTWHVYNTSGGPLSSTAPGTGVNSMENVKGKKIASHPNGGYFKSANHYTSTCNDCNDPTDPSAAYGERSANVSYTPDQVSSSITGDYYYNGRKREVAGAKNWTFNQIF